MSEVTIYIPAMKLKRLDFYCKEKGISRSRVLVAGAMAIINHLKAPKCAMCFNSSVGKFKVGYYDESMGMTEVEKFLCETHRKKVASESEVSEL